MRQFLRVHGSLLLVNLIFGANYSIAKEVMPDYIQQSPDPLVIGGKE